MRKKRRPYLVLKTILITLSSGTFTSCVSTKNAVYFNNVSDTTVKTVNAAFEPVIQKNDILQITVSSLNPQEAVIYNLPNASTGGAPGGTAGSAAGTGFLVDQQGFIQYPVFGQVKAEGLTTKALTDTLRNQFEKRQLLLNPVVNVRFLNYRVTVLGEVAKPAVVNVTSEKISILEALGMAGDITVYGKKDNVMLIREVEGQRTIKRLNLNEGTIFTSPYYFLQPNDIVYVEPTKSRVAGADRSRQVLPVVLSGLSLLVIILDRLVINN